MVSPRVLSLIIDTYLVHVWSWSNDTSSTDNLPGLTWYVHCSCWNSIACDNRDSSRFGGNIISGGKYSIQR